jgi:ankyrin repeat protein
LTKERESALAAAARQGHAPIVEYLLQHGANVNARNIFGNTPLMSAAQCKNETVVRLLLQAGADVRSTGAQGETAYLYAARYCSPQVLAMLEKRGADIAASDASGRDALLWAAAQDNVINVDYLITRGFNVNKMSADRWTPLLATRSDATKDKLMSAGADVKVADRYGNTPLHYVCQTGNVELAARMIKNGAEVNTRNKQGYTALMFVQSYGANSAWREAMERLLTSSGAKESYTCIGDPKYCDFKP